MILDHFENVDRYSIPQLNKILDFISTHHCLMLPNEQIDIDGKDLFVRVMEYTPKPAHDNKFETHQIYADLQYVVAGIELMQIAPSKSLSPLGEYDKIGDYHFFKADQEITDLVVSKGDFTYFYPGEAHRPSCLYKEYNVLIKKLVFKIKIN
ncbi:MAG: YhcH/YjgK/YiaL family protein [Candidatus Omnitrophica bacterium]|nr:YhcH/YjgK/YiaL family protein [Candidatus Omnitrophota bacterium]